MSLERLRNDRIIPVIVMEAAEQAESLAEALKAGGLSCAEVTLRTENALSVISAMCTREDLVVGAGTVLSVDQARAAVDAGAQFIVSPGFSRAIVDWCVRHDILVIPGCATATELQQAMDAGVRTVKFFPAELLGGVKMLRTLGGVFAAMQFMPTGGIGPDNLKDYLSVESVVACGGSWMVKPEWLQAGNFRHIREEIAKTVALKVSIESSLRQSPVSQTG